MKTFDTLWKAGFFDEIREDKHNDRTSLSYHTAKRSWKAALTWLHAELSQFQCVDLPQEIIQDELENSG